MDRGAWPTLKGSHKESDTTEQLTLSLFHLNCDLKVLVTLHNTLGK